MTINISMRSVGIHKVAVNLALDSASTTYF